MDIGKVAAISRESEGVASASDGEVMVDKTFAADEFPVPAIKLVIGPMRDEATRIRVTDRIPKSSPMENVGSYLDFGSDNWTAYKNHRVEYKRTLDPDEGLVMVYGIRITGGHDQTDFLEEPTPERIPVDGGIGPDDIGDIPGEDHSQTARDVLADSRDPLRDESDTDDVGPEDRGEVALDAFADPDSEVETADATRTDVTATDTADAAGDEPSDGGLAAVFAGGDNGETDSEAAEAQAAGDGDGSVSTLLPDDDVLSDNGEADDESAESIDPHTTATDTVPTVTAHLKQPDVDIEAGVTDVNVETDANTGATGSTPTPDADGPIGAFAIEIRSGAANEDNLGVIREVVDTEMRRSIDVRIRRFQSWMENIAAYSDALTEFIDEEGTGSNLISEFRARTTAFHEDLDALDPMADDTVEPVDDAIPRLDTAEEITAAADDRFDRAATRVTDAESRSGDHDGRLEGPASDLDTAEDILDDYRGWLESHNEQLETVEGRPDDHNRQLETTSQNIDAGSDRLDSAEETLTKREEELVTARERLDDIASRLDETVNRFEGAESSAAEATERVSTFHDEVGDTRGDVADFDGGIVETQETLGGRLAGIQSRAEDVTAGEKTEALRDDIRGLGNTVAEPETSRERLAGAFGTGVGGGPATSDDGGTDEAE